MTPQLTLFCDEDEENEMQNEAMQYLAGRINRWCEENKVAYRYVDRSEHPAVTEDWGVWSFPAMKYFDGESQTTRYGYMEIMEAFDD